MELHDYLRHTLDPVRLAILGSAFLGQVDTDAVAGVLGVRHHKVLRSIVRLTEAGLLDPDGNLDSGVRGASVPSYQISRRQRARSPTAPTMKRRPRCSGHFFEGSRLTKIPSARSKRLIVLERLAQEFDFGVRYPEKQVSFVLQFFHSDYAALRRYLVDEGFLTRSEGVYWRSGGRYDVGECGENPAQEQNAPDDQ